MSIQSEKCGKLNSSNGIQLHPTSSKVVSDYTIEDELWSEESPSLCDSKAIKSRENHKAYYRRKHALETEEERRQRLDKAKERARLRFQTETEEQRQKRIDKCRARYHQQMQNETEEERQRRLDAVNEYRNAYYWRMKLVETEEQKRARSEYRSELARKMKCRETEEDRLKRMEYKRLHARKAWNKMTEDEHELAKAKMRERARRRLQNETPEQRKMRLQYLKDRYRRRKEQETPEEAEACRKQQAEYKRQRNQNEIVRQKGRERSRIYQQKKRQQPPTPEEKAKVSLRMKQLYQRKKMTMTEVERQEELARGRDYRLKYATKRKMEDTELGRQRHLERVQQKAHRRRLEETEKEREERRGKGRQYYRRKVMEQKTENSGNSSTAQDESSEQQISSASKDTGTCEITTERPVRCSKLSAQRKIRNLLKIDVNGASTDHELPVPNETRIVDKLSMKAVVLLERIRVSDWSTDLTVPEAEGLEISFLVEPNQSELDVKSEKSHVCESFDFVERQMSPEMEGSKTAAVDSLQVDNPSSAQTVELSSKSLIEKWGLRELVVRLQRIDVLKMVRYK